MLRTIGMPPDVNRPNARQRAAMSAGVARMWLGRRARIY